jgi:hypothetical protein
MAVIAESNNKGVKLKEGGQKKYIIFRGKNIMIKLISYRNITEMGYNLFYQLMNTFGT